MVAEKLLLAHCRTPKQKQKGLIPEKDYSNHDCNSNGSNLNELKGIATYLERGFLLSPFSQISVTINIFQQVKGRILSKLQYIFHPKLKKKKTKRLHSRAFSLQ